VDERRSPTPRRAAAATGEHARSGARLAGDAARGQANCPQQGTPGPRRNQRWIIAALIIGALAINLWISSLVLQPNPRVRIPYSPTFLTQIKSGNVSAITSTEGSIQGTFKAAVK
jgi:hypothetical protein